MLCGAEVCERKSEDWPWGEATPEAFEQSMATLAERWGLGQSVDWIAPSIANEATRAWWGKLQTHSMTPPDALAFMRIAFNIDVRQLAPSIHVPTLIIHRVGDRICHVENARWLARNIAGAHYVELQGIDHAPFAGANDILPEIQEFLTGERPTPEPDRILATVLLTDIVGSTRRAIELGDGRWRDLLDSTGDGILATFDGPARAVRCARALRDDVRRLGLEIRAGLHAGEIELIGDDIGGTAVHTAARVTAKAEASEIWVSRTVKDLVAGSGLEFSERGVFELKGIPGAWPLFTVD